MNKGSVSTIRQLRALMPQRPLGHHEAKSVAERQATLLLELLGQCEPAVDVGLIAELPRVDVQVEPSVRLGGVSGFSQWSRGRWLIVVNRDESGTRRRFTLSHEFKHVLDHPFAQSAYSALGNSGSEQHRMTEQVCDYFAACLLMPRNWLKRTWANGIQDCAALAATFNTSEAAMSIRLQQIGLVEPKSRHAWFRGLARPVRSYFRRAPVEQPSLTADTRPTYLRTADDSGDELLTVAEACAELRVSKWTLYQFIRSRQLSSVKLRRRRVIPRSAIHELIEKLKIEGLA